MMTIAVRPKIASCMDRLCILLLQSQSTRGSSIR
ncbi:unnamed protein product [Amoebophrya sp. A120]|nr:unnamed protein product [Amoebophrya sp. A120]|eukprot:GSA120T00020378001.1